MIKKKNSSLTPVSVIVPMRNSATTLPETLRTIIMQKYPIEEIIVVDNVSKDNSREIVLEFKKKYKIPISLIQRKKDLGVASSYNLGAKKAKSELIIFLTSDASLPTDQELKNLTEPLRNDKNIVASYPSTLLPSSVWETYNFWQKFHSCRDVDIDNSTLALKFDCLRKDVFLQIGGFDELNFGGDSAIGGEDADLMIRLQKKGKVIKAKATAYHLHYSGGDYNLSNLMKSRKMTARSYGRFVRKSTFVDPKTSMIFLIKPILSFLPFMPGFHLIGMILLFFYAFLYTRKMFTTSSTLFNLRIIFVPFLNIFLLYYETFWLLEAFFTYRGKASFSVRKEI